MNYVYKINTGLSAAERLIAIIWGGAIFICWFLFMVDLSYADPTIHSPFLSLSINLTIAFVCATIVRYILFRDIRETHFLLTGDSILKKSPSSIAKISFSAITHFELRAVPFLPKQGVLAFNGGKMQIPLRTENVVRMIAQLQYGMVDAGSHHMFANSSADDFRRIALCAHISDRRLTKRLPLLIRIAGLFLCIIMVTARYSWQFPFVLTFLWGIYGLFLFGVAVVVAETVLLRMSISKFRHKKKAYRYGDETRVYLLTAIIGIIVICASGIALTNQLGE